MVKLTFYGGVREIGGNKILLEDGDTRIFLDFGMNFSKFKRYYGEFLQPRLLNGLGDLMEFGIIPELDGIYRDDLLRNEGKKPVIEPEIDGVVLSHAHADHAWHISLLHNAIPIYCGITTKLIMGATQASGRGTYYMDLYFYRPNFVNKYMKPLIERRFECFKTGDKIKIGSIEIEPVHVDHSLPGSYGFIIHTSAGAIVYTGDIRQHGPCAWMTAEFIERAAAARPIAMICEGTRISENIRNKPESIVQQKLKELIIKTPGLVLINYPIRDIDRFKSVLAATQEAGRLLAISTKQAFLLDQLRADKRLELPKLDAVHVFVSRRGWGRFEERDYPSWERPYLAHAKKVTYEDIRKEQRRWVVYCDFWDLKDLIDLNPQQGSAYIHSMSEHYLEEAPYEKRILKEWLEHFRLPMFSAHTNSHMTRPELKEMIQLIGAKQLFPIHTEYPERFRELSDNVSIVEEGKSCELK